MQASSCVCKFLNGRKFACRTAVRAKITAFSLLKRSNRGSFSGHLCECFLTTCSFVPLRFLNLYGTVLDIKHEVENEFYKREAKDMVNIVQRLIAEGERSSFFSLEYEVNVICERVFCRETVVALPIMVVQERIVLHYLVFFLGRSETVFID